MKNRGLKIILLHILCCLITFQILLNQRASVMSITLRDIEKPQSQPSYSNIVSNGPQIMPQQRLQLYSPAEWEKFTEEYADGLKADYKSVMRIAGAGDQGIDIAGLKSDKGLDGNWDNYQCKHYDHALHPGDIWLELGKLCYYTFIGAYNVPDRYYFVCPFGVGTTLAKMLRGKHDELKSKLIGKWSEKCENDITSTKSIPLEGKLKEYVENFDFSIIKDITVLKLLEVHITTPHYHHRFGGGLPDRPVAEMPPEEIAQIEATYIQKLLDAYAEYLNINPCGMEDVSGNSTLQQHLQRARVQFYSAETLHKFSRDYLPAGEYQRLQDFIFAGIENIILTEHANGFEKVKSVVQEAFKIQIDSHPLKERLEPLDRGGICHQLANNNRVSWAKK